MKNGTEWKTPALVIILMTACVGVTGCAAFKPRPEGVSWQVNYSVQPIYPKSFEIVAGGPLSLTTEELTDAWKKKAALVANGRRFKATALVVHNTLSMQGMGYPLQTRTVTGTITLTE
ncbi:MAG TPA: hypothetical protein VFD18_05160 [Chthoniobacterales bacterium]|nr:hypothetical protein [Chthoniobacterales bacterium]